MNLFAVRLFLSHACAGILLIALLSFSALADTPAAVTQIAVAGTPNVAALQADPEATPPPDMILHLTFSLVSVHRAALETYIQTLHDPKSPHYHHWLTPQQVGQMFGATDQDVQAVADYARSQGFTLTHLWPNHLFIAADATVAQAQRAFGITLQGYQQFDPVIARGNARAFYASDLAPQVPIGIARRLSGIYGLSNNLRMHSSFQPEISALDLLTGSLFGERQTNFWGFANPNDTGPLTKPLGPGAISTIYNVTGLHNAGLQGQSLSIGVFSPTTVNDNDIAAFASYYNISGYNIMHTTVNGGATDGSGAGEACLDGEMIIGQDNNVTVNFYESPNDGNLDIWNMIASDDTSVLSDSWSYDEKALHDGGNDSYVSAFNTILATMDAQGQAHYNSSGDAGAYNGTANVLSIGYPGSSPHVTCVGGTALPDSNLDGTWADETAWAWNGTQGSGGGLSLYFSRPSWQVGPGVNNGISNGMRQTPDISSLADPNHPGIRIYSGGRWVQYGGTSAAAPFWSATPKLIEQGYGSRIGSLNADIYDLGTQFSDQPGFFVFHDITKGSNGGYSCTSDWDYVTGWGSADFYKLYVDYLELYGNTAAANLTPYNPGIISDGTWTSPLMISTDPNSVTEPSSFNDATTYYFNAAILDLGPADTLANNQSIQIDGIDHKFSLGPFASNYIWHATPFSTKLSAGTHTIKLIANADSTVAETNLADNTYTRTITVAAGPNTAGSGHTHVLWTNPNGSIIIWDIAPGAQPVGSNYGPFPNTTALCLADGPDGHTHVLWQKTDKSIILWDIAPGAAPTGNSYGPYPNLTASSLAVGPDNHVHVLWKNTDNSIILWDIAPGAGPTGNSYGPYANWTAQSLSAGP